MKEALYLAEDLLCFLLYGGFLAYLLEGMLPKRFTKKGHFTTGVFMALQFCAVRMAFTWLPAMKRLVYGRDMFAANSRQSIIPIAASIAATLLAGVILYRGSRMKLLSLTAVFYAQRELVRFFLYPAAVLSMNFVTGYFAEGLLSEESFDPAAFQRLMGMTELIWNTAFNAANAILLGICVKSYKRDLIKSEDGFQSWEAALLFVPGLMGLLFTAMLRCILFYYDNEVFSIVKRYPELNAIIPGMSFLCMASVLMSAKMLARMTAERERRQQAERYRSQTEELMTHVQDMESVYMQIRGMKHDMKNYIADIKGLLLQMEAGDAAAWQEVRHYADSMQASLSGLDMQCATANPVTDVIVGRYMRLARQKHIAFSSQFTYPKHLGIDVFDISIILNNGLENAMEACEQEAEPFASLLAVQKGNMFLISIENAFEGAINWADGWPVSKKNGAGHGLGLKNIRCCAEKYYGRVDMKAQNGRFCLTVMLQGKQ